MWKTSIAAVLLGTVVACRRIPQRARANQRVAAGQWELQVLRDGQQIDAFAGTTNVGQARTDTHHHVVKNNVGCADKPAGDIDLQRTLTVSPVHASADDVTLPIEAQETFEENTPRANRPGCKLPPQPRQRERDASGSAVVKPGEWTSWHDRRQEPIAGVPGACESDDIGDGCNDALNPARAAPIHNTWKRMRNPEHFRRAFPPRPKPPISRR